MTDNYLPTRALLEVPFRHILLA